MCGIAGFLTFNKAFSKAELINMAACLAHRGPDADGFFFNEIAGLGHKRLSIIDLSDAANQPMFSHSRRFIMVYNGEVYNFREIAESLKIEQRTKSDTEVVLQSFEAVREKLPEYLNGMFALAIYDTQENSLFLCRDRIGKKPLFYYWDGKNFAFASEIKSLLKLQLVTNGKKINKTALNQYLYLGYIPEPHTIYENIHRFPAGSYAVVLKDNLKIVPYWKPEDKIFPQTLSDAAEAKQKLNELVVSSVKYRMISDVPFGCFLSGGTDSSLVSAVAQTVSSTAINTYSIGFKEAKFNESEHARAIANYLGTNHHEFMVSQGEAMDLFEQIPEIYDEPFADSSAVPSLLVSRLARQHVKMTLSGDGGDETHMGYGFYRWAERLKNPFVKAFRKPIGLALSKMSSRYQRAAHLFQYENEQKIKSHIFSQEQYNFSAHEIRNILSPDFYKALPPDKIFKELPRNLSAAEHQALFDLGHYLKDDLLVKVDRATMRYSVETRVPLLDYRLVEFALNLDENLKVRNGVMKYLLKEVLYDYIPKKYFEGREKWGFSMPLVIWLKKDLRHLPEKYLNPELTKQIGLLNPELVQNIVQQYFSGKDYLYQRIWIMIMLHKWYLKNF